MVDPTVANAAVAASGRTRSRCMALPREHRGWREAPRMPATGASECFNGPLVLVVVIVVVHVHDLATTVEPAVRAHVVRTARPAALRAAVRGRRGDLVLRPALRGARVRLLLLGDGHGGETG